MAFPLRAFTMATLLGASTLVWATPGALDTTFGTGGIVTTAGIYNKAYAVAIQPDGKVLAAGSSSNGTDDDVALARYNADGTLDTGFGTGGMVTTPIGTSDDRATAIALQPDGKVVAAGYGQNGTWNFGLVRFIASDTAWDLTPDPISFTDQSDAPFGSPPTSNTVTISGLGEGVEVPVQVSGGSYSLNGGAYSTGTGW